MRVVVMGGTAGIGLATARALGEDGAEVIVTGRDPGRLAAAKEAVTEAVALDATVDADVEAFFGRVGSFDHLVLAFSPGAVAVGSVLELEPADVRRAFEGKLFAYLTALRYARVTGSVTMISAASARGALPGTVALAAANGAIERAVPVLAAELAPVRVNAVSPGVIDTAWWAGLPQEARAAQFAAVADSVPMGRVGQPDDVARAVRYLVETTYVTGTTLPVDGGLVLR